MTHFGPITELDSKSLDSFDCQPNSRNHKLISAFGTAAGVSGVYTQNGRNGALGDLGRFDLKTGVSLIKRESSQVC